MMSRTVALAASSSSLRPEDRPPDNSLRPEDRPPDNLVLLSNNPFPNSDWLPITLSGATLDFGDGVMERDARLLVAGSYPDKNLTVTEADIDALITNFSGPVPVKVEHINSPLDPLGLVIALSKRGSGATAELHGRVKFPKEMATFLSERNAHKLSIGLLKEPAWKLLEASLTLTPHVPTATLLSDPLAAVTLSDPERVELAGLRAQVRKQTVDAQIIELKAAGKVLPATEALARVLLSAEESAVVTLSDGASSSVSAAALSLLRALPPLVHLSELAGGKRVNLNVVPALSTADGEQDDDPEFTDEEHEVCRRMGVKPEDVKATMRADRMAKGHKREP
jgi:hypothetical protein